MVITSEVTSVMRIGELAIRVEKRWIPGDSLVQQFCRLQQIRFCLTAQGRFQQKILGATIEIERSKIARRCVLDGQSFARRNFGVKLLSDLLCNFALNSEHVF